MKILTGVLMSTLLVGTGVAFFEVWRAIPSVSASIESMVPQVDSVQMGLSSAEQNQSTPEKSSRSPATKGDQERR